MRLALTIFGAVALVGGVGLTGWAATFWRPCFAYSSGAEGEACGQRESNLDWWVIPARGGQEIFILLALLAGGVAFALGRRWSGAGLMLSMLAGSAFVDYLYVRPAGSEDRFEGIWMGLLTALGGIFAVAAGRAGRRHAAGAGSWRWVLRGYATLMVAAGAEVAIASIIYWHGYLARTSRGCFPGSTLCVRDPPGQLFTVGVGGVLVALFVAGYVLASRGPVLGAVVIVVLAFSGVGLDRVVTTAIVGGAPWQPVWAGVWTGALLVASGLAALAFARARRPPAPR